MIRLIDHQAIDHKANETRTGLYLEYVGKVPEVKDVMELDRSGQEGGSHSLVHS